MSQDDARQLCRTALSGWGNFPCVETTLLGFRHVKQLSAILGRSISLIARGNGRAYGDAAINTATTVSTLRHDRIIAFDPADGTLTCEAGLLLSDIVALFLPRGWFVPVTPGTRFVTVGGMIAADVHGKNHHRDGSFGRHVQSLRLMTGDGQVRACSRESDPELFRATIGGMGLTGVIVDATFRLCPVETAFIRQQTICGADLDATMAAFEQSRDWTYTVAWIDCLAAGRQLGRSVLFRGEHARRTELRGQLHDAPLRLSPRRRFRIPLDFPGFALNRFSVKAFNELYYRRNGTAGAALVDAESFFYPLDAILEWNRIYGRRGFMQYQCVLPKQASRQGLSLLLARIAASGSGSFLAVLKLLGAQDADGGLLSFPMEGYTLALDFPATAANFALLTELDAIVADHCGRLYLAKDARMGAGLMRRGYGDLDRFLAARNSAQRFQSVLSQRLGL